MNLSPAPETRSGGRPRRLHEPSVPTRSERTTHSPWHFGERDVEKVLRMTSVGSRQSHLVAPPCKIPTCAAIHESGSSGGRVDVAGRASPRTTRADGARSVRSLEPESHMPAKWLECAPRAETLLRGAR